jgi:hypothetical protein
MQAVTDESAAAAAQVRMAASRYATHDAMQEQQFKDSHGGMSRGDYAERERMYAAERQQIKVLADIESDPPPIDTPAGMSSKRRAYAAYHAWLTAETATLTALEAKRAECQAIVDAPAESEGTIRATVRRVADRLLNGLPSDASDALAYREADAKRQQQQLAAEAAAMALNDLERPIEIAQMRVNRLREREREFLSPVLFEAAEGLRRTLARVRAEAAALEDLIEPLFRGFAVYGVKIDEVETPSVDVKWRHSWHDVADALAADPTADVSKLLPVVKF